jgi:hypothetical protein
MYAILPTGDNSELDVRIDIVLRHDRHDKNETSRRKCNRTRESSERHEQIPTV